MDLEPGVAGKHLLKNGHPAHVLTTEDRRKAAESTNAIRRLKREALEDERFTREIEAMLARDDARRARKSRRARERYLRKKSDQAGEAQGNEPELYRADLSGYELSEEEKAAIWVERGYGAVTERAPDA